MRVEDYVKRQVNLLFKQQSPTLAEYVRSLGERFPSSTTYYDSATFSSEQLANQFNSQSQDILQLQLWLEDLLADADGLTEQLNRYVDQVYYTTKYSLHQKRQADILRFMPQIEQLQILSPSYATKAESYARMTDCLVRYPTDGGLACVSGVVLPPTVGQMYQSADRLARILYAGAHDSKTYSLEIVLSSAVEVSRVYVLDKLGICTVRYFEANGQRVPVGLKDYVWYQDVGQYCNSVTVTIDQHVFQPYLMSEALQKIMTLSFAKSGETLRTGVPVLGQLEVQVCFGEQYSGYQVYEPGEPFELVFGLNSYTIEADRVVATDDVINEPILFVR